VHLATHFKSTTQSGDSAFDITSSAYYEPTRGIDVYRHSVVTAPEGSTTRDEYLKSLTPKAS
jgi:hypothetical protein